MAPRPAPLLLAVLAACGAAEPRLPPAQAVAQGMASARASPPDDPRAARLFQEACEGGSAEGCSLLASLLQVGRSGPPDPPRVLLLHARACEGGWAGSCQEEARLLDRGAGAP